jgi:hypothetical protein
VPLTLVRPLPPVLTEGAPESDSSTEGAPDSDQQVSVPASGKSADQATEIERLQGYIRAATLSATRAELQFLLEGATTENHSASWNSVLDRWTQPVPDMDDSDAMERFVARLAADGLWVYESLSADTLDPELRRRIADHISERFS